MELMWRSTARTVTNSRSPMVALLAPDRHLGQHLALAGGEVLQRGAAAAAGVEHRLDHPRVDDGAAGRDRSYRLGELARLGQALLEQVRPASHAVGEQRGARGRGRRTG